MLLFGHTGIVLGVAWLLDKVSAPAKSLTVGRELRHSLLTETDCRARDSSRPGSSTTSIDYRPILLGSILPDIIDKPLGVWLLRDILSSGRVFGHTLLCTALLAVLGIYFYGTRRKSGVLCVSFGSLLHLCLDQMWRAPKTLFWPLYGWGFARADVSHLLEGLFIALMKEPSVYIPEIVGIVIVGAFLLNLVRQHRLYSFIRAGTAG